VVTIPRLETNRLILRGYKPADFDAVAELMGDGEWSKFIGGPLDRNDAWRSFMVQLGHWEFHGFGMFALEEKQSGEFVGLAGNWFPEGWPEPEMGWSLMKQAAGKGYATEAVTKLLDHTFNTLKWDTVISLIAPENVPSQKVAERVGAVHEKNIEFKGEDVRIYRHPNPNTSIN
jgi:RimJ/RimL family protein N-acetyltransferase